MIVEENTEESDVVYEERPRSMVMAYLDMKMEIAKVRGRTSRGAYVVTLQLFETGAAMLGFITDKVTGKRKYDSETKPMKGLIAELKLIKIPKVTVKVAEKYTRVIISGAGEWEISKNTEEAMLTMIENERYDAALRDATALLTKVELLLYHEGILDPIENMESQAEIRWLSDALAFDIDTIDLGVDDDEA